MYNFNKAVKILSKDIEEIEGILEGVEAATPAQAMELKLALSKLKNLRENFALFAQHLEEMPASAAAPPLPEEERSVTPAPPSQPVVGKEEKTEVPEEPKKGVETAENEEKKVEKKGKAAGPKKILSDTLQSHEFRNEQLGKEVAGHDLSSKLSKRAVTDLRKIINLNDKFMFIRELFDGDKTRYEETLRLLNAATRREEAEKLLGSFQWDRKSEAAKRFLELVERKLSGLKHE